MFDIRKLNIKVTLTGNVEGSLEYKYNKHTDPESMYHTIYFVQNKPILPELLKQRKMRVDPRLIFLNINTLRAYISDQEKSRRKTKVKSKFFGVEDIQLEEELNELRAELKMLEEIKEYQKLANSKNLNGEIRNISDLSGLITEREEILDDIKNLDISATNLKDEKSKETRKKQKAHIIKDELFVQKSLDEAKIELADIQKEIKIIEKVRDKLAEYSESWRDLIGTEFEFDDEIIYLKETIQEKQEKLEENIINKNIELILALFFKVNSNFYVKGKKFIIKRRPVISKTTAYIPNEKYSYTRLSSEYLDKETPSKVLELTAKSESLMKRYEQIRLNSPKNADDFLRTWDRDFLVIPGDTRPAKDIGRIKDHETHIIATAETMLLGDYKFKKFISDKIYDLENEPYNKHNNIKYRYFPNQGIKLKENSVKSKSITIELFILDGKNTKKEMKKYNCKTKKNKIRMTLYDVFGIKYDPAKESKIKPNHYSNLMHHPLYSNPGYITNPTRKQTTDITDYKAAKSRSNTRTRKSYDYDYEDDDTDEKKKYKK